MKSRGPGPGRGQSFERYYLRHVAISEGCGCSELVIRGDDPKIRPSGLWRWLKSRLPGGPEAKAS